MAEQQSRAGVDRPYTVSEVNRAIRGVLEPAFRSLWLCGELAEITLHSSGHVYFTLKDSQSQLRGVAFRYVDAARQAGLVRGMAVEVFGSVSLFEPRGECQVYASRIRPKGEGEESRKLEELKARLAAEGLFDMARKRPIPPFPRIIGLVTASTGAAKQDFLKNLACPIGGKHVRFIPSRVQGNDAPRQLAAAIGYFSETQGCDVIVVTRGGGGVEDLSAFNDEQVVRAVASSAVPVISAVGHDRDLSLCDYAADCAVSTPTAAANLVVRGTLDLCMRLGNASQRMIQQMQVRLGTARQRFERLSACHFLEHPEDWLGRLAQRLDYGTSRLGVALPNLALRGRSRLDGVSARLFGMPRQMLVSVAGRLQQAGGRLDAVGQGMFADVGRRLERSVGMLKALNPRHVLTRGYSVLLDGDGHAVLRQRDVSPGQSLRALLAEGEVTVRVTDNGGGVVGGGDMSASSVVKVNEQRRDGSDGNDACR